MATAEPVYMEAMIEGQFACRDYYDKLHAGEINTEAMHIPICPYTRPESVFDTCNAWHGWHAGWNIYFLCRAHEGGRYACH